MKFLLAADIFPPQSGGPATYVVALANAFPKEDVVVVSLNPNSDRNVVRCLLFSVHSHHKLLKYWQYFWLLYKQSKNVDVIYAMGPVNAGLPALLVSKLRRKKLVVKVVGDYAWEQGIQRFGVRELVDDFQKKSYGVSVGFLRLIQRVVTRQAHRVIVPAIYLRKLVKGWGVPERKIEVIYNAVTLVDRNVTPRSKPPGEQWIVCVARLVPWKGVDTLIDVVAEVAQTISGVKLKIVGDGPDREKLESRKNQGLTDIVELTGNLPQAEAFSYIAAADVFVLNSAYEGMSHVLLEAVSAGVPVLASYVGGNPEVVTGWDRGEVFLYNNKEHLKEKIFKALRGGLAIGPWTEKEKKEFWEMFSPEVMVGRTRLILGLPKVLMISLDKHFFDLDSQVASRVLAGHVSGELFVIVPSEADGFQRPHSRLLLFGRGGSKVRQFITLWWLGRKLNRQERFAFITTQDPFFTGLLGLLIRRRKQEVTVQVHGDFYGGEYYKKNGWGNLCRYYLGLWIMKRATQIRVVSKRIEQSLLQRGLSAQKIYIQPVKIDTQHIQNTPANFDLHRKYIGAERVFVFLGRLDPVKNLSWLIDVFAEAVKQKPKDKLLIVGNGPTKEPLEKKVRQMNLEGSIIFEPWTSDPISFFKTADALLFPSLSEGYGLVVLEAITVGCPVIMNNVGVAEYEVQPGLGVQIIPVTEREKWIEAILLVPKRL